jgi:predicted MFS family arabinose efflux permease
MNQARLTPGESARARAVLSRYNFFNVISFVLLSGNIITLFALRMGAGSVLIGILSSISYASYAAIFLGRALAPRLGIVRLMGRFWLLRYFAMVPILAAPVFAMHGMATAAFVLILLSVSGFSICRGIAIPGYNPIIGEITTEQERGGFLARLQGINHTVTLLLGIVMALLLGRTAPLYVYNLFIIVGITSGIIATSFFFRIPEPGDIRKSVSQRLLPAFGKALRRAAFRKFTVVHLLVSFATFMITPFLILYLKDVYGQPDNLVVFYTVFGSLGGVLMALISGFLIDRLGAKPLYFLFTGVIALSVIPLIISPSLDKAEMVVFSAFILFLHNLGSLGAVTAGQTYFFNAIEPEERLNLGALYYLIEGVGGGLGSLAGGFMIDRFRSLSTPIGSGYSLYFICVGVLFLVPVALASRMERLGAYTIADTLSIIFSPRDLRAISLLHRLRRTKSLSEEKSVIEALAGAPSEVSIGEILTKLKSPRFTIRVEALTALRKLPANEREIEPLMRDVKNQTYTTAYLSADIIGMKGYKQAIPVLRKHLYSENFFLSGECMVALARLKDRESLPRIRQILERTTNPRLIIHAAAALEIYRDLQAVPALLEKLEKKTSPYLRDEILLSAAGILGMGIWFYPLYTRFLEKATEGISLLEDQVRELGCHDVRIEELKSMIRLITSRDRTEFAARAAAFLKILNAGARSATPPSVSATDAEHADATPPLAAASGWFARALADGRYVRLDRFCFLAAAFVVWSCRR